MFRWRLPDRGCGRYGSRARLSYEKALKGAPAARRSAMPTPKLATLTGTVARIGSEYGTSGTTYYLVLSEKSELLFSVQGSLSDELALTREGDRVRGELLPRESGTQELTEFDNLQFTQN